MQVHSTLIPDEVPTIKNYSPIQLNPLLSLTDKVYIDTHNKNQSLANYTRKTELSIIPFIQKVEGSIIVTASTKLLSTMFRLYIRHKFLSAVRLLLRVCN